MFLTCELPFLDQGEKKETQSSKAVLDVADPELFLRWTRLTPRSPGPSSKSSS